MMVDVIAKWHNMSKNKIRNQNLINKFNYLIIYEIIFMSATLIAVPIYNKSYGL
jgi:hypothetical protein